MAFILIVLGALPTGEPAWTTVGPAFYLSDRAPSLLYPLVIVYLGQRLYLRVRAFPASQVATMVVLLLALYELVLLVIDGFAGREVPLIERWAPVLTGGLVWLLASAGVERGRQAAEAQI